MSGRFVRASKYRHVFGQPTKKEQCYDGLRISKNAWDTNLVKVNPKHIAVNWEASGGGAFAVIPLSERGRLPDRIPLFRGHTSAVLDTDWNPFNDDLIASASDDSKIFLWRVPDGFTLLDTDAEEPADVGPVGRLSGHTRKVGHVLFNNAAANVLASSSGDFTVKIWDIEKGSAPLTLKHAEVIQSLSWNAEGSLLVTTSRDKKLRIWDVRQEKPAQEVPGHPGAKNSRAVWMGEHDRIATTGFSRMSDRQLGLWDARNPSEPLGGFQILDSISGVCMPFWDDGTNILYLAGKGDGNIRYFEYANDKFEYLSEYKSPEPQRGLAFMPKRGVNVHETEVMRAYKTVNDTFIEPISFIVPRKAEVFQEDIYPPTTGIKPAMSSGEWFSGKTGIPPKISMQSVYQGDKEPAEVPSDYKPPKQVTPVATPPPTKTSQEPPKPEPVAAAAPRDTMDSMKKNKEAMAAMADKFADKDGAAEEEESDESFEEVPKPIERPSATAAAKKPEAVKASAVQPSPVRVASPIKASAPVVEKEPTKMEPSPTKPTPSAAPSATSAAAAAATPAPSASGPAQGLKDSLQDIKEMQLRTLSMLESQQRTISKQMDQISFLSAELETLKTVVGEQRSGAEKDERIRRLELEVEELRSQI